MLGNTSESVETLAVKIVTSENDALASLCGRIDIDSSPALRRQLLALVQGQHLRTVSIDLSGVVHMDSSGVATLIEALRVARGCNTHLTLQGLDKRLLRLFESTGILQLFNGNTKANSSAESKAF